jgi:hypothetical protein
VASLVGAASAALLGASAGARAADNPACAKFNEPLAYNACLAQFGPPAREVQSDEIGGAVRAPAPTRATPRKAWPARRGWAHSRAHAQFVVRPR